MPDPSHARLFVAGVDAMARPLLGRVEIDGDEARVLTRAWVDPMVRSGRGGSSGVIASLGRAGTWLLVMVERGRPRLIEPERLDVIALLGRRREWRGAATEGSPFLPVVCDRAPVRVGGRDFMLTRTLDGRVDLLGVRPGEPIERWSLAELGGRVELFGGASTLALVAGGRVAMLEIGELSPGGFPLTDPRDVSLSLRWWSLPETVVGVCDLREGPTLRVIEQDGDQFFVTELELGPRRDATLRASWAIAQPRRWLASGGELWLASAEAWTRVGVGEGPGDGCSTIAGGNEAATLELDANGRPWLWLWDDAHDQLVRVDGLAPSSGSRWSLALEQRLRAKQLLVFGSGPAVDPSAVVHADELAELLGLEPELRSAWASWFDR